MEKLKIGLIGLGTVGSGVNICKETFNVNAEHIIDPVFLVDKTCFTDLCDEKNY